MNAFMESMKEFTRKFDDSLAAMGSISRTPAGGGVNWRLHMPPQPQPTSWLPGASCCGPNKETKKQQDFLGVSPIGMSPMSAMEEAGIPSAGRSASGATFPEV